jgi:hypothetical protein
LAIKALPASIEHIGQEAFMECSGIEGSITVPGGVRKIYIGAFSYTKLTALDLSACDGVSFHKASNWDVPHKAIDILDCIFYDYNHNSDNKREGSVRDNCEVRLPGGLGTWKYSKKDNKWNELKK